MPDGPDHPESWIFHMAMAWIDDELQSRDPASISYAERLAMIKERARSMGEPARSAFLWVPHDTEVHRADISYWVTKPWDNRSGRITLVGDAAHPMPPYRGQGLNHCINDVWQLTTGLARVLGGTSTSPVATGNSENNPITGESSTAGATTLREVVDSYEREMIPRGAEEVSCSVENGLMLHDWQKVQESPVFKRGFKPMDGHSAAEPATKANPDVRGEEVEKLKAQAQAQAAASSARVSEHAIVQMERDGERVAAH